MHLSPEVVRRISDNPDELKLKGEERIITALFADIEGFTSTTERIGAERMVDVLDRYVDTVAGLIVSHGGMVDKIVGDGIVALFNAPVDLPGHPEKALACAKAIVEATEALRREQDMKTAGLGRTRIGLETGPAMLGDVGRGAKRSYTAMGRTMNMASRLELANKELGTSVLAGPGFAKAIGGLVKPHAVISLDGIDGLTEVYVPATPQTAP
ncbi:MAG: adenylate/guanylate cyclase domain-containing protein [Rhizobiales bacterium]|nr:adenylate/guanylate cyclase domain-containing protein [Hyphomicrobiales bacterium]